MKCAISNPILFKGIYPRVHPHYVAQTDFKFAVIPCIGLSMNIADMDHHTYFISSIWHVLLIPVPTTVLVGESHAAIKHHDYKKICKEILLNKLNPKLYNYSYVYFLFSISGVGRYQAIYCQEIATLAETIPRKPISSAETQLLIHKRTNLTKVIDLVK